MKFFNKVLVLGLLAYSGVSEASVNNLQALNAAPANKLYVASAGEVMVTFLSKEAAYTDDLFLKGTTTKILDNQSALGGQTFSLGSFKAGAELTFNIFVNNTGHTFYTGPASNNEDNIIHAKYEFNPQNTVTISFEDLLHGGDKDFNDLIFKVSNVAMSNASVAAVPEEQSYAMLLAGLFTLGLLKRRKS